MTTEKAKPPAGGNRSGVRNQIKAQGEEYTAAVDRATLVRRFRREEGIAARRRGEIDRLCAEMRKDGVVPIDGLSLARVAANALAFKKLQDLTSGHVLELTHNLVSEVDARRAVAEMQRRYHEKQVAFRLISNGAAGKLLALTRDDRRGLEIRTIEAVDETREERKAFVKERRRAEDKVRKARQRLEGGMKPRTRNLAKDQPWEALGVSRAKFYRARLHETKCPLTVLRLQEGGQTVSRNAPMR